MKLQIVLAASCAALFAGMAIAADTPAPAVPAAEDPAADSNPRVSRFGEALFEEEFRHRRHMGQLNRELEVVTIETRIENERAAAKKAREVDLIPEIPVAAIPPNASRKGPVRAGVPGIVPHGQPAAGTPAELEPEAPPKPPKPLGMIDDKILFNVDRQSVVTKVGDPVGAYQVESVNGRFVTLKLLADPAQRTTVQIP